MSDQMMGEMYTIALPCQNGTVVVSTNQRPLILKDHNGASEEIANLTPVERAVISARLRAWASAIEGGPT